MTSATDLRNEFVGRVFGRLTVMNVTLLDTPRKQKRLLCRCICGNDTSAKPAELRIGEKKSCGCLKATVLGERTRTHGRANSRVSGYKDRAYGIWQAMRDRCSNPNRSDYKYYGGKGIGVCDRWRSFENFLADMGEPPSGLTLDRIDGDKGYTPDNCRWASRKEQTYNSKAMKWIEVGGVRQHLAAWLRHQNIAQGTYYARRRRGASVLQALELVKE